MADFLKLGGPKLSRLAIEHVTIRVDHGSHIEGLLHTPLDLDGIDARGNELVEIREHVKVLGVHDVGALRVLLDAEALVGAGFLNQIVAPATRLHAIALVGGAAYQMIADKAAPRNRHAHGAVHEHLKLHVGGKLALERSNLGQRHLSGAHHPAST